VRGLDAGGVHRTHLLHNAEEIVDLGQHALALGRGEFEPGKIGNPGNIVRGQ